MPWRPSSEKTKGQSMAWLSKAPSMNEGRMTSRSSRRGVCTSSVENEGGVVVISVMSLSRSGDEAGDVVALEEDEEDDAGQHRDGDARLQGSPVDGVERPVLRVHERDGQGEACVVVQQHEGGDELVPGCEEREECDRDDARCDERQHDAWECADLGAAVELCRLDELFRHALE